MNKIEDINIVIWVVSIFVGMGVSVVGGLLVWSIKSLISSIMGLRIEVAQLKAVLPTFKEKQEKAEKDINNAFQRIQKLETTKGVTL